MLIETLSTFPDMYSSVMGASIMKRAQEKGILEFKPYDLRDWTHDRHRTTDDGPYGGGSGLVMKCEPIFEAAEQLLGKSDVQARVQRYKLENGFECVPANAKVAAIESPCTVVFMAPQGRTFNDELALELSKREYLLFICGHYEGIDERAYALADEIISLGDYVLTSGELASMVIIDAVVRKLPGVLGAEDGAELESFADGLLEHPQYTRPSEFLGLEVPDVLLSGNHAAINTWRRQQQLARTAKLRPDLLKAADEMGQLSSVDQEFIYSLEDMRY